MEVVRKSSENEMILEFLKGELNSNRFNSDLNDSLNELNVDSNIISNGDLSNEDENSLRLKIMKKYRGYPDSLLFENFPRILEWKLMKLDKEDINNIYYIDYDYWNLLSNDTSSPLEAVKNIMDGREIFDVSNKPFLDGVDYLKSNSFPPVILITCNDKRYLIVEGHSRMTIYGFDPTKLDGIYAYVGYCSSRDMKKYDPRMLEGESLKSRKYKF